MVLIVQFFFLIHTICLGLVSNVNKLGNRFRLVKKKVLVFYVTDIIDRISWEASVLL